MHTTRAIILDDDGTPISGANPFPVDVVGTPEVKVTGPVDEYGQLDAGQQFILLRLDELIAIQKGMLALLEAAFEDGISGRDMEFNDELN